MAPARRGRGGRAPRFEGPRCNQCIARGRGSRCNREHPCASCTTADTADECTYGAPPPPASSILSDPPDIPAPPRPGRGMRLPIERDTPSNPSIARDSPPPLPPRHAPAPRIIARALDADRHADGVLANAREKADRKLERELLKARLADIVSSDDEPPPTPKRPARPSTAPAKHTRPTIIPGALAPGILAVTPQWIVEIFKDNSTTYVPLSKLTDAYCISHAAGLIRQSASVTSARNTEHSDLHIPDVEELRLSPAEWAQGWKRMAGLNHQHLPPEQAAIWDAHHDLVYFDPSYDQNFDVWLRYDIQVRSRALQEGFDPSVYQVNIFNAVQQAWNREYLRSLAPRTRYSPPRRRSASPPSSRATYNAPSGGSSNTYSSRSRYTHQRDRTSRTEAPQAVQQHRAATARTFAPSAAKPATTRSTAETDPRKIITPFRANEWHRVLDSLGLLDQFHDIPPGLSDGFPLGASLSIPDTFVPPNHKSALNVPDIVQAHIDKELSLGRYSGPFTRSFLNDSIGHFRCAPLGVVSKPSSPGEFRIIQDFSFPRDNPLISSVNSEIDVEGFPCVWSFFNDVLEVFIHLSPLATAATLDVESAYRRIPIDRRHQPNLVVHWDGKFYVDHCAPFGAASSNGNFGRCGDAMQIILAMMFACLIFKWVDDFLVIRSPPGEPGSDTSKDDLYSIASTLGWTWKDSKTKDFAPSYDYLGFHWDIPSRIISIPPPKLAKYIQRVSDWLAAPKVTLLATQQLLGTLMHCTSIIHDGRAWLAGLIRFSASFPHAYSKRFVERSAPEYARDDAHWWLDRLTHGATSMTASPPPPEATWQAYMDASTSFGVAIIVDGHHAVWRLMQGWDSDGRDIGWAEMVALELSLEATILRGFRNTSITFNSDNQGVVYAFDAGRSRNRHQNEAIKRIAMRLIEANIRMRVRYIASADNPADPLSRNEPVPHLPNLPPRIPLPEALAPFLARAFLS